MVMVVVMVMVMTNFVSTPCSLYSFFCCCFRWDCFDFNFDFDFDFDFIFILYFFIFVDSMLEGSWIGSGREVGW